MPIVVACRCGQRFAARDELAGQSMPCPVCGAELKVPAAAGQAPVPVAKAPAAPAACAAAGSIVVACGCGQRFAARAELAGKSLPCPVCGAMLVVPAPVPAKKAASAAPANQTTTPAAVIPVVCECGGRFGAPPNLAGRRVPCPNCGRTLQVPAAPALPAAKSASASPKQSPRPQGTAPAASPPPTPAPVAGGLSDLLDEVGMKSTAAGQTCVHCKREMKPGAVLCIHCGYDHASGRKMETRKWV